MAPTEQVGIPPGWKVLDEAWTTVLNREERRAVEQLLEDDVDSEVFACYQRWGTELEFSFIGWVATYEDAEEWLAGRIPGAMAVSNLPALIPGLCEPTQFAHPQKAAE